MVYIGQITCVYRRTIDFHYITFNGRKILKIHFNIVIHALNIMKLRWVTLMYKSILAFKMALIISFFHVYSRTKDHDAFIYYD